MKTIFKVLLLGALITFLSCEDDKNTLSVSKAEIIIPADGGDAAFMIETNANSWNIENPASDWISTSKTTGTGSMSQVLVHVESRTLTTRADTIIITAGNAIPCPVIVTQGPSEYLYELSTNRTYADFGFISGSITMTVTSDAPEWNLSCDADWVEFSKSNGGSGSFDIKINVANNTDTTNRATIVTLTGTNAPSSEIPLTQRGCYPDYNKNPLPQDMTGMSSTAAELADKINIGWNIGNTLEAIGGETNWGNPQVNNGLINLVKQNGFNAIRIPCSWDQYSDMETGKIDDSWLDRVKTVVQYCVDNDMYVILNIHWDGGWLENNCTAAKQYGNNAKQKAYWEQIATCLRDFDEHLLFASANEPNVEDAAQMQVLLSYHQTFVDAVRSTGGKNSYRVLVVQGPSTDIEKTNKLMTTMPTDEIDDRMMAEVHFYSPYQFTLMGEDATWGKMHYYWGNGYHSTTDTEHNANWGEEDYVDEMFGLMKSQFVNKGIPVILGEFGVIKRTYLTGTDLELHLASRAYYLKYVVKQAKANGIIPFYWDAGNIGKHEMTIFNRSTNTVHDQQALDGMIEGANE